MAEMHDLPRIIPNFVNLPQRVIHGKIFWWEPKPVNSDWAAHGEFKLGVTLLPVSAIKSGYSVEG